MRFKYILLFNSLRIGITALLRLSLVIFPLEYTFIAATSCDNVLRSLLTSCELNICHMGAMTKVRVVGRFSNRARILKQFNGAEVVS